MPIECAQLWICDLCEHEEHKAIDRKGWIQREIPNYYEPNLDREFIICPDCQMLISKVRNVALFPNR